MEEHEENVQGTRMHGARGKRAWGTTCMENGENVNGARREWSTTCAEHGENAQGT